MTRPAQQVAARVVCQGKRVTIVATPEGDVLRGTARSDVIAGLGGNDRIFGLEA